MEGGEGPKEKEVAESGETDPALHDGSQPSTVCGAQGWAFLSTKGMGWGDDELPSGFLRGDCSSGSQGGR